MARDRWDEQIQEIAERDWLTAIFEAWLEKDMHLSGSKNIEEFKARVIAKSVEIRQKRRDQFLGYGAGSTAAVKHLPYYDNLLKGKIDEIQKDGKIDEWWKKPSPFKS